LPRPGNLVCTLLMTGLLIPDNFNYLRNFKNRDARKISAQLSELNGLIRGL
jgi:hypothetical protein